MVEQLPSIDGNNEVQQGGAGQKPINAANIIMDENANAIVIAARTETSSQCGPLEIMDNQASTKLDEHGRPTEMSFKDESGRSSTLSNIKYNRTGNDVSAFNLSIHDANIGDWDYKFEKNSDGYWHGRVKDEEIQRDFGQITIIKDSKTGQFEIHGTGLHAGRLGDFIKDDGFMSDQALRNKDQLSEKMAAFKSIDHIISREPGEKFSKEKLAQLLVKEEAGDKTVQMLEDGKLVPFVDQELIAGYKKLIADFDKIANGKNEISSQDLAKHANDLRDGVIALAIANTVAKGEKLTYPADVLTRTVFDKISPFLLLKPEDVRELQKSVNAQFNLLGNPASTYSVQFGDKLINTLPHPDDIPGGFAFTSPPMDRLLKVFKNGKPLGEMRITTRTDITDQKQ